MNNAWMSPCGIPSSIRKNNKILSCDCIDVTNKNIGTENSLFSGESSGVSVIGILIYKGETFWFMSHT